MAIELAKLDPVARVSTLICIKWVIQLLYREEVQADPQRRCRASCPTLQMTPHAIDVRSVLRYGERRRWARKRVLAAVTEALYAVLTDEQKQKADQLLGGGCGMM